jgi:type III secretory pathway lipoprotein EscJ
MTWKSALVSLSLALHGGCCREGIAVYETERTANEAVAMLRKHQISASIMARADGRFQINVTSAAMKDAVVVLDRYGPPQTSTAAAPPPYQGP